LPPISATATSPSGVANGSAPGVRTATTPSGSNVSRARLTGCSERASPMRSGASRRRLGEPVQRLDGGQQLHRLRLGERASLLGDDDLRELVPLVDDRLRGAHEIARAV